MTKRVPLNHGPCERAYPFGRQPWSYHALITWAKANGYAYEFRRDFRGVRMGLYIESDLFVPRGNAWAYYRGI